MSTNNGGCISQAEGIWHGDAIMFYEVERVNAEQLMNDSRLLSSLMGTNPTLTVEETKAQIQRAYDKAVSFVPELKSVETQDGEPCPYCGSTLLIRTGVCRSCSVCATSLGCS